MFHLVYCVYFRYTIPDLWNLTLNISVKRSHIVLLSFPLKQNLTLILILQFVLPWSLWESAAGNNLAKSLCLTLLGGGTKTYLGVPFCYCINVVGGRGLWPTEGSHLTPASTSTNTSGHLWDTYRVGHTSMGRAV